MLDTNVVVSAQIVDEGPSATVFNLAMAGSISMYVSPEILAEYEEVLGRTRFGFSVGRVRRTIFAIRRNSRQIAPAGRLRISPDEADNRIYECAVKAKAHYIVTGNIRHFPQRLAYTRIVTPRQFLEEWRQH